MSPSRELALRHSSPRRSGRSDAGSSLVLAMVFLSVVSVVLVALVNWVGNDLRNTAQFTGALSLESTASSAAEIAVQNVRYNFMAPTLNASPPAPCWTASPSPSLLSLNGESVDAWCTTRWHSGAAASRVVTISVCRSDVGASECAVTPLLQAIVTFGDYNATTGIAACEPVTTTVSSSTTTCGTTMKIVSWVFAATPPVVTSVTAGAQSCGTTKPVVVQGTGFSDATAVSFVMTSGAASNQVYAASSFTVDSSTQIEACTPNVGSGSAYVVVTTASGPSAYGPTFTY